MYIDQEVNEGVDVMVIAEAPTTQGTGLDDAMLVYRCLNNDSEAWNALVEKYARLVYSVPFRYGLAVPDAEEVFQTVWTKVVEKLSTLRDVTKLSSWLITTASRESWRLIRGRQTARVKTSPVSADQIELLSPDPSIEAVQLLEEQQLVHEALKQMPDRWRHLLWHLYYDPLEPSYKDVASHLGIPVGSVGPQRARCLKKLKGILNGMGV